MLKLKANAKINLTLDVTSKREDGYHNIKSVMQSVSLADYVSIEKNNSDDIYIECSDKSIPCDERNIAYKAVKAYLKEFGESFGVNIHIEKNIPTEAGLGGGSADGAGVLALLNKICGDIFTQEKLCEIGAKVGADIPFCLIGGTCLCEGIGEKITPITKLPECFIVIAKGDKGISTKEAFLKIDECNFNSKYDFNINDFNSDIIKISSICSNIFEECADIDEILDIKSIMLKNDALCSVLSGSGSAVYGIFTDFDMANDSCKKLALKGYFSAVCTPEKQGLIIV